jgi:aerobic carbon-monoxide dehydrogenase medium subunit
MKPAPFTYHDPRTVGEAVDLLARLDDVKALAGGQSLMPLLNMRLATPAHLVDLNRLDELAYVSESAGTLRIGAMTRQRDVEQSPLVRGRCPLLADAMRYVGHVQTRNRGTIGGSLAHLDPAAELTAVAAATDAVLHATSGRGQRDIPIDRFVVGYLTSCLESGELLTGVTLTLWPAETGHAFVEYARRHGDFAVVGVAALVELAPGRTLRRTAIALTGVGPGPVRARSAERALEGATANDETLRAAADAVGHDVDPHSDLHASGAYRRRLATVLTRRALALACERATRSAQAWTDTTRGRDA